MKVDNVLILAAGAGTRMGEIGKKLPKVLWPVFEKSILELEVLYAEELGAQNIYINTYNYKEKLISFYKDSEILQRATLIEENEKLDIGGAVHNLAKKLDYKGDLLILNSDQFIFLSESTWEVALKNYQNNDHLLFSYNVNSNDLYNALSVDENNVLQKVTPNNEFDRNVMMQTYTGMSLINLNKLKPCEGESNFFKTVANYTNSQVYICNIEESVYWDFGTIKRYKDSCFNIIKNIDSEDPFIVFIKKVGAIKADKVKKENLAYNSIKKHCINLGNNNNSAKNKIIIKESRKELLDSENVQLVYEDIILNS